MKKKPTLGIYSIYFLSRKDLPLLLINLSKNFGVKLFVEMDQFNEVRKLLPKIIEVEQIKLTNKPYLYRFYTLLFTLFGKLPRNKASLELSKTRNILARSNNIFITFIKLFLFRLKLSLPKFISFDLYCESIKGITQNDLEYLDNFLFISPIVNPYFVSDVIEKCKNVSLYVYSWDHPYKFNSFPSGIKYLTWNKSTIDDLKREQYLDNVFFHTVGCSQFVFLHDFKEKIEDQSFKGKINDKYIIYSCFSAYKHMVDLEISIIKLIESQLLKYSPNIKLFVRPYPTENENKVTNFIKMNKNIFNTNDLFNKSNIDDSFTYKYNQIANCLALFHCGTTLGVEASLLNIPTYLVSLNISTNRLSYLGNILQARSRQSHLFQYMTDPVPSCYIDSMDKLSYIVKNLESEISPLTYHLRNKFNSISIEELTYNISNSFLNPYSNLQT